MTDPPDSAEKGAFAVHAPWPDDVVQNLIARQRQLHLHPYTCGYRSTHVGLDDVLFPTDRGWRCPSCDYRQTWAHSTDCEGRWPANPFKDKPNIDHLLRQNLADTLAERGITDPAVVDELMAVAKAEGERIREARTGASGVTE